MARSPHEASSQSEGSGNHLSHRWQLLLGRVYQDETVLDLRARALGHICGTAQDSTF